MIPSAFDYVKASTVDEAVAALAEAGEDAKVLGGGQSLLEALRSNASTQRIGFILMTGRPDRSIISRGHLLGMNNFIAKPFTTQGLKGCIEKVVGAL